MGEWENGRMGEWENGRTGERTFVRTCHGMSLPYNYWKM
jgi:hypothetical protein